MTSGHPIWRRKTAVLLLFVVCFLLFAVLWRPPGFTQPAVAAASPAAAPEAILTGFSPIGLLRNDTHLFVARQGHGLESCQLAPSQSTVVLQRVNFDGGNSTPLLSRCHFTHHGIVADNSYVYIRDGDLKIRRIPVGGGALQVLVDDAGACCDLAVDGAHLYWARRESPGNNNAIFRMLKAGGPIEQIASVPNADNTYYIRALALDATHIYWVEGKTGNKVIEQAGVGAVRKMPKTGGPIQTLADNAQNVENPGGIALDDTHVFWTERDTARARRVPKNGGAITNYAPVLENLMGGSIAVTTTDVYWTDTNAGYAGRLRRASKAGGDPIDMAIGILGPGQLVLSDSHIYWAQHGGVYRLPLGSGEVAVDFSIDGIEVTQAIQDMSNSVPLVAEKYALARVYPRVDLLTGQRPQVQLRAFKGAVELSWSPLPPINPSVPVFVNGANRFLLDHSFNFKLPPHWREGEVLLRAEINFDGAINELNTANNSHTVVVDFNHKKPLCVEMVRVKTSPQTASTGDPGFGQIVDWLRAAYPVPTVLIDAGGTIKEAGGSYELPDDTNKVLARVGWYRLWHTHNKWQQCGAAHFYGMVHPSEMAAGGIGYRPGWSAWGVMATDSFSQAVADAAPWYAPHGGAILAHEVAHNKNRKHVDCGGPDQTDNSYPYNPCNMGSGFPGAEMGYEYSKEAVIGAWDAGDLMSYAMSVGKPRWPSDYTYEAIYDKIPNSALSAASTADLLAQADYATAGSQPLATALLAADDILLISALVTPTLSSAEYDQVFVVPEGTIPDHVLIDTAATTLVSSEGDYTIRLFDAGNAMVGELQFEFPDSDGPPWIDHEGGSFVVAMPFAENANRVVLLQEGMEVASRTASARAPAVRVLEPNGGESYAGSLTIRWEANDLDGDPLSYLVQYSPDNGATWRLVESEVITDAMPIVLELDDVSHLPGTQGMTALVRVFASDGLRTGSDVSNRPFSLRPQPPQAWISNPSENEIVGFGHTLTLLGNAIDAEDGTVADSGLSWQVDGIQVGMGSELPVNGLSLGKHSARLMAVDSGGMSDTVEHTFFVQKQYCDDNPNRLDLVFVIDNSPAMSQHVTSFCQALPGITGGLRELGIELRHEVFDVAAPRAGGGKSICATADVQSRWRTDINHGSDWGKAVAAVAANTAWKAGYSRMIVPVTNQGPEDGNPTEDPGPDRDAIEEAIAAAVAAAAAVSPLMMPPADSVNYFANMQLVADIASATGGEVMQWGAANLNVAETLQDVQARLGCSPTVDSVNPDAATFPEQICLLGGHLWPGTTASVGGRAAPDSSVSGDGAMICFDLPPGIDAGTHTIDLDRPGARPNTGAATIDVGHAPALRGLYLPLLLRR